MFPSDKAIPPAVFNPNAGGVLGVANLGSLPACAIPAAWANADDPPDSAHELGHLIGFDHWGCEHRGDEECKAFPIPHGGTGGVPIDINKFAVIPSDRSATPPHAHDFMTTFVDTCCKWVSWYTYQILMNHSHFGTYDADDPPALVVSGRISPEGVATFRPIYRIDVPSPPRESIVKDDPNDIWTMRGYDTRGNTLLVHNFEPAKHFDHPSRRRSWVFREPLPPTPNLTRIAVFKGAQMLGELQAPTASFIGDVKVIEPNAGTKWYGAKTRTIRWHVDASPGAKLTAFVSYSPDGGKSRVVLRRDVMGSALSINTGELAGGKEAIVYVQVSDGFRTVEGQSAPFFVKAKPPSVHIMTPNPYSRAFAGVPISLSGRAFDRQESIDEKQFVWSSDHQGILGTGREVSISTLRRGLHRLTLRVTDHANLHGEDSVRVLVVPYGKKDQYSPR